MFAAWVSASDVMIDIRPKTSSKAVNQGSSRQGEDAGAEPRGITSVSHAFQPVGRFCPANSK